MDGPKVFRFSFFYGQKDKKYNIELKKLLKKKKKLRNIYIYTHIHTLTAEKSHPNGPTC